MCLCDCRDEQYRIMWNELETLVKTHAAASERHHRVLECIVACRSKPPEEDERKKRGRKREDKEDRAEKNGSSKDTGDDKSWQDVDRSGEICQIAIVINFWPKDPPYNWLGGGLTLWQPVWDRLPF